MIEDKDGNEIKAFAWGTVSGNLGWDYYEKDGNYYDCEFDEPVTFDPPEHYPDRRTKFFFAGELKGEYAPGYSMKFDM